MIIKIEHIIYALFLCIKFSLILLTTLYYAMYNIGEMEVYMKQQLKKGVLEIFVLAMLSKEDSYGYKLITDLTPYVNISESTLYPILRRLEKQEQLKTYNRLHNGRNRKYYKITLKGVEQIDRFLEEWKDIRKIYDILTKD